MLAIFLRVALRRQEVIVAATATRVGPADCRTCHVDRAAPFVGIEEAANLAEMLVGLAAHRILFAAVDLGELLSSRGKAELKMICQPLNVALGQRDDWIG